MTTKTPKLSKAQLQPGERVTILAGDERGGWGVVDLVVSREAIHVKIYGGEPRVYERRELRRIPRKESRAHE